MQEGSRWLVLQVPVLDEEVMHGPCHEQVGIRRLTKLRFKPNGDSVYQSKEEMVDEITA